MRFYHILTVCHDPNFYLGTPLPLKPLLESTGIIPKEKSDSSEEEFSLKSELDTDTTSPNAYETFIAPSPKKDEGFFFPRR